MKNVKKYLAFLLVMVLLAGAVIAGNHLIPTSADAASYKLGDVDGDGEVSAGDARLALRAAVGLETLEGLKFTKADVDKDGEISASDARTILRMAVGLEKEIVVDDGEQTNPEYETKKPPEKTPVLYVDNLGQKWGMTKEQLIDAYQLCRYCEKVDCKSLPKYNDGSIGLDYLCPQYDITKDPNPDYSKVCRYCGKTDCVTLEKDEHGFFVHSDTDCPKYDVHKDPAEYCQTCGLVIGDPAPNTCAKISSLYDIYCPVCGTFLPRGTCHHCKGNSQGYVEIYNISTGELE